MSVGLPKRRLPNPVLLLAGILLLISVFPVPGWYIQGIRVAACAAAIYGIWLAYRAKERLVLAMLAVAAIFLGPLLPFLLTRSEWAFFGFLCAALLVGAAFWLEEPRDHAA